MTTVERPACGSGSAWLPAGRLVNAQRAPSVRGLSSCTSKLASRIRTYDWPEGGQTAMGAGLTRTVVVHALTAASMSVAVRVTRYEPARAARKRVVGALGGDSVAVVGETVHCSFTGPSSSLASPVSITSRSTVTVVSAGQ